jgi:site-specific DNA recombinase
MRGEPCWKVAAYIRLSREDGNDESLSVSNQRKILKEYLERSFQGDWVWCGEYVDDGLTGTDQERPGFQALLQAVGRGAVNCIVCKTLSRAFRNYADQGYYLESFFPRYGVRFISLAGPYVDSYLQPEALFGYEVPISGIMNDRYAARTSMDVRRTLDMKRRQGEFIGAFAPYGYTKNRENKGALEVDEEAAAVVRQMFAWRLDGWSCQAIARALNQMAVPTPSMHKRQSGLRYQNPKLEAGTGTWSTRTVSEILKNPVYIGTMVQGRQRVVSYKVHQRRAVAPEEWFVVEHTHPAIVDETAFRGVQRMSRGAVAIPGPGKPPHLLSGLLYCARCGRMLRRKTARGYGYYACKGTAGGQGGCRGVSVREDRVLRLLMDVLQKEREAVPCVCASPSEKGILWHGTGNRAREVHRLETVLDELYVDWKMNALTNQEYLRLREHVEQRMEKLKRQNERQEERNPVEEEVQKIGLDGRLLRRAVDRLVVGPGGTVEIYFSFQPTPRKNQEGPIPE